MKYGIYYCFGANISYDNCIKAIKDAGFDSICFLYDLSLGVEHNIKMAQELGLNVENLHMPYSNAFDIFSLDDDKANAQIKLYKDAIDMASFYKIPVCVIHLTGDNSDFPINYDAFSRIKDLILYSKSKNVSLAFENLRGVHLKYLTEVLDTFNDENVGLCYDLGHDHCFNKEHEFELLSKYGHRLKALHLHNNYSDWDYHYPLSKGDAPLDKLSKTLHNLEFTCPISLEVLSRVDVNNIKDATKYCKQLLQEVKDMWESYKNEI